MQEAKGREVSPMSANARDYAFIVRVKEPEKPEPKLSKEKLEEIRKRIDPYVEKKDAQKV